MAEVEGLEGEVEGLEGMYLAFTGMVDEGPYPNGPDYMRDYRFRVFVTRADGSDLHPVSQESDPDALYPSWNPDGQTLTYEVSYRHDYSRNSRYRVRIDGLSSTPVRVNSDAPETYLYETYGYNQVYLSPDRLLFAVTSLADEGLFGFWLVTTTGERVAACAPLHKYVGAPTWSPDGTWIAFTAIPMAEADDEDARSSLFVLEWATGVVAHVCSAIDTERYLFAWAPDSWHLVAVRDTGAYAAVFVVERDGTGLRHILDLNVGDESGEVRSAKPAWSPDGRYLAVSTLAGEEAFEIVMFTADGQRRRTLAWSIPVLARIDDLTWRPYVDGLS